MWLRNLRIVLPDRSLERGSLWLDQGQIAAIVEGDAQPPAGAVVVEGQGLVVLPGVIDMHGDMFELEVEPRPGARFPVDMALFELDKRLAATGVTTAYAAISFWNAQISRKHRTTEKAEQMVAAINTLRDELLVDLRVHARYEVTTPDVAPALLAQLDQGRVQLLSLMDHTPGQGQYRDVEQWVSFAAAWRNADRAEVEAETHERIARAREQGESIWSTASALVALARAQGLPIASHDDDTSAKIDLMADFGVTISEFPVTLEAAQEARRRGLAVAMGAPNLLRGSSHAGNLSALDAVRADAIDLLAADYSPAALVQAVFELERQRILPLHLAARLVGQNVAAALGLNDRGRIEVGLSADLVLVEAAARPRVRGTIRRGEPIYWDAALARRMVRYSKAQSD